jgi:hypothetical protein
VPRWLALLPDPSQVWGGGHEKELTVGLVAEVPQHAWPQRSEVVTLKQITRRPK